MDCIVMTIPSTACDDSKSGKSVSDLCQNSCWQGAFLVMGIEFRIHRLFDLECVSHPVDHQLQGVAKKINGMMVFQELRGTS
jgi:hypothetical protein